MKIYYTKIKMTPEEAVKYYISKYPDKANSLRFDELYNAIIDDEFQLYSLSPNRDKLSKLDPLKYYKDHGLNEEWVQENLKRCQNIHPDEKLVYVPEYNFIVSDNGHIYSIHSKTYKQVYNNNNIHGYTQCKNTAAHIIIVKAFGIYEEGKEVDHINNDRSDNRLCNLRMLTHAENMHKQIEDNGGVHHRAGICGEDHPRSKTILQYSLDGKFIKEWGSQNLAAKTLGYQQKSLSDCANGKTKSAYGYIWKHKEN